MMCIDKMHYSQSNLKKKEYSILDANLVNDEHPLKASSSIEVTEDGIVTCFNDVHL